MIKVKLSELVKSATAIKELGNCKMPAILSLKIAKIIKQISQEVDQFTEVRSKRIIELGEKQENGEYQVKGEALETLTKELEEILEQTAEIKAEKLKISDFESIEIEANHLAALDWLIKE